MGISFQADEKPMVCGYHGLSRPKSVATQKCFSQPLVHERLRLLWAEQPTFLLYKWGSCSRVLAGLCISVACERMVT